MFSNRMICRDDIFCPTLHLPKAPQSKFCIKEQTCWPGNLHEGDQTFLNNEPVVVCRAVVGIVPTGCVPVRQITHYFGKPMETYRVIVPEETLLFSTS